MLTTLFILVFVVILAGAVLHSGGGYLNPPTTPSDAPFAPLGRAESEISSRSAQPDPPLPNTANDNGPPVQMPYVWLFVVLLLILICLPLVIYGGYGWFGHWHAF